MDLCVGEVVWLRQLLKDLGFGQQRPTVIYEDNTACIHLANNPQINKRTKHIDVRFHWIREKITNNEITIKYCPTKSHDDKNYHWTTLPQTQSWHWSHPSSQGGH